MEAATVAGLVDSATTDGPDAGTGTGVRRNGSLGTGAFVTSGGGRVVRLA
jgi:hypothetical protein